MQQREEEVVDRGIRFGLDDETFQRWWASAINPEDGEEFVHLFRGNMVGARFVCAIDLLRSVYDKGEASDLLVRAYCLAKKLPESAMHEHVQRINTQALYNDASVQTLIDRVSYRSERAARDRIVRRHADRLEKLYERSEKAEKLLDDPLYQAMLLGNSARFLGNYAREKDADNRRRERNAVRDAITRGREAEKQAQRLPTPAEAVHFLSMLRDELGPEEFENILGQVKPKELGP